MDQDGEHEHDVQEMEAKLMVVHMVSEDVQNSGTQVATRAQGRHGGRGRSPVLRQGRVMVSV
jgi:hypothetical protein